MSAFVKTIRVVILIFSAGGLSDQHICDHARHLISLLTMFFIKHKAPTKLAQVMKPSNDVQVNSECLDNDAQAKTNRLA